MCEQPTVNAYVQYCDDLSRAQNDRGCRGKKKTNVFVLFDTTRRLLAVRGRSPGRRARRPTMASATSYDVARAVFETSDDILTNVQRPTASCATPYGGAHDAVGRSFATSRGRREGGARASRGRREGVARESLGRRQGVARDVARDALATSSGVR